MLRIRALRRSAGQLSLLSIVAVIFLGCDRLVTPRSTQQLKDADAKVAAGDFTRAISLYESALEDRPSDADVHYKLGLLYDDKLNDPLNAIHHFNRYLVIAPSGAHASDVRGFVKRDQLALVTNLSGDAMLSRTEATRLRNENLALRHENDELNGRRDKALDASKPTKGGRTYVVQQGDTLASISRKFFKSSAQWKRILNANRTVIDDPKKLTAGQTLVIPGR